MTHVDLRTLRLAPGDHRREQVPVTIAPFTAGAQEYRAEPSEVRGRRSASRGSPAGCSSTSPSTSPIVGPCQRCLEDARIELDVEAREYQADDPEVEDEETTPYLAGELLDIDRWAHRRADPRAADRDPLPRGLRGPVPAVRRRPQRRRVRLRAAQGRALGAAARAVCSRSAARVRYASARVCRSRRRRPRNPAATSAATRACRTAIPVVRLRAVRLADAALITCAPRARRTRGARSSRSGREHHGHRRARRDGKRPGPRTRSSRARATRWRAATCACCCAARRTCSSRSCATTPRDRGRARAVRDRARRGARARRARARRRLARHVHARSCARDGAEAAVSAGSTGAVLAAACSSCAACRASCGPAIVQPLPSWKGADRACSTSARRRIRGPSSCSSSPTWARPSPPASWASHEPRVGLLSIGPRSRQGQPRSCIDSYALLADDAAASLRRQHRGPRHPARRGRRRRHRRLHRQRRR